MQRIVVCIIVTLASLVSLGGEAAEQEWALRMIIVKRREEAREIHTLIQKGSSFSALAYERSMGSASQRGGYGGIVRLDELQQELQPILRTLRPGEVSEVIEVANRYFLLKAISPKIPQYYKQAEDAWQKNDAGHAIRALNAALQLEQDSVQTLMLLGLAYEKAGQFDQAITHLEKAQHYIPESPKLTMLLGVVYTNAAIQQRNLAYAKRALNVYRQALTRHEHLAPAIHFGMGKVYFVALKQPEKAIPHLEQAVAVDPRYRDAHGLLIQAYYDTKRYQQAWKQLRVAQGQGYEFPELVAALHKVSKQSER